MKFYPLLALALLVLGALGCPALAQAAAAGAAEAPALQRQYCPPGAPPKQRK